MTIESQTFNRTRGEEARSPDETRILELWFNSETGPSRKPGGWDTRQGRFLAIPKLRQANRAVTLGLEQATNFLDAPFANGTRAAVFTLPNAFQFSDIIGIWEALILSAVKDGQVHAQGVEFTVDIDGDGHTSARGQLCYVIKAFAQVLSSKYGEIDVSFQWDHPQQEFQQPRRSRRIPKPTRKRAESMSQSGSSTRSQKQARPLAGNGERPMETPAPVPQEQADLTEDDESDPEIEEDDGGEETDGTDDRAESEEEQAEREKLAQLEEELARQRQQVAEKEAKRKAVRASRKKALCVLASRTRRGGNHTHKAASGNRCGKSVKRKTAADINLCSPIRPLFPEEMLISTVTPLRMSLTLTPFGLFNPLTLRLIRVVVF